MRAAVIGAKGMLGTQLVRELSASGDDIFELDREELDVTEQSQVSRLISELKPEIIFNCAAYNAVDKAEQERSAAIRLNSDAVTYLAEAAKSVGATLVHYSTGYVFGGKSTDGYKEDDKPNPQSIYARSKHGGEQNLKRSGCNYYLIRLNLLFGPKPQGQNAKPSFPETILQMAKTQNSFNFVDDEISTPTYAVDLAKASIALARDKHPFGTYHLVNEGTASWYDYACEVFKIKNISPEVKKIASSDLPRAAIRPKNSVLINTKFPKLRTWQSALKEFLQQ